MSKQLLLLLLIVFYFTSCTRDKLDNPLDYQLESILFDASDKQGLDYFRLPDSEDLSAIPQDPENPLTPEKVALGKMLFFETGLALASSQELGRGTYSCASCHVPSAGFMPGRPQGIADGGIGFGANGEGRLTFPSYAEQELDVQGIRPLSMLNVAYVTNTTWSGQFGARGVNIGTEDLWGVKDEVTSVNFLGFSGLESQNIRGLDLHRMVVGKEIMDKYGYTPYYDAAFEDVPKGERYSKQTTSFAISAYLRTLLTNESPWQQYLAGDNTALTDSEKRGAILFFTKARCGNCHTGPALNSMGFYALGVNDLYQTGSSVATSINDKKNLGRGGFTGKSEDMFKFKVPQLYNLASSPFYFHGASKQSLKEVVEYFKDAVPENQNVPARQIAPHFRPLHLSDAEVGDIVTFLSNSLYDQNLERYVPEAILSGNCFPNNDILSRVHLGCQ